MSDAIVYWVQWEDLDRYQSLNYDLPDTPRELRLFDGVAKADSWEPPPVYSEMPRLERPDFWHLWGSATIVMASDVVEELAPFLYPVGELLPLRFVGEPTTFFALNILRDIDCLNPAADRIDDLQVYTDFIEHRLPESGLFKVPQVDETAIFYLERSEDEDAFRGAVERNGYRGLTFEPVWASDGHIEPINLLAV